ncbi:hypothetical protein AMAG_07183 [Allomyces macrogynus ATCC 38327]|uniref:Glutamate pyruvate transaminase n=1 Tax=Allomyces macrogynus (strain ATCC 38327) TaxID=578462 RepID=A0A0L0SHI2_ALLM3|nr:hypothetical protein AMAG_07183 [Allomyces macrogynus ATCC 38327]|eukprot:KNE61914.1 hypothetical protein AMAG_07183 [Allomyces macrogynus ATCC 38327]
MAMYSRTAVANLLCASTASLARTPLAAPRLLLPAVRSLHASAATMAPRKRKVFTYENLNPHVKQAEYAVRGELAIRAEALRKTLDSDQASTLSFDKIVNCNIGNPQQLGQQPITFLRQVSSLLEYPALLDDRNRDAALKLFPADAIDRAKTMSKAIGSLGAYSHSMGIPAIRNSVAKFMEQRDGFPANPDHIFLTAGASPGVQTILQALIAHDQVGVLVPIPQYPLYTAAISLCNGRAVPYYLDEEGAWTMRADEVRRAIAEARNGGTDVRALCVINPGNPTGNVLSKADMEAIIKLCHKEGLLLMADEVYQTNVYYPKEQPWYSFKHVLCSMGGDVAKEVELVSFHSISKGMIGECGRRGGYFEVVNVDPRTIEELYKIASISLCPNVQGQVAVDIMVNPPQAGSESYDLYNTEMTHLYESLKRRAEKVAAALNQLEGVQCNRADGAMYLFPKITLPQRAIEAAEEAGKEPDAFYTLALLDATGVCTVPGSGFLQRPGTFHFRSTFLPPEDELDGFIARLSKFHKEFFDKYRG